MLRFALSAQLLDARHIACGQRLILRQRGIIRTAVVRGPVAPLDEELLRDLQIVVDELYSV